MRCGPSGAGIRSCGGFIHGAVRTGAGSGRLTGCGMGAGGGVTGVAGIGAAASGRAPGTGSTVGANANASGIAANRETSRASVAGFEASIAASARARSRASIEDRASSEERAFTGPLPDNCGDGDDGAAGVTGAGVGAGSGRSTGRAVCCAPESAAMSDAKVRTTRVGSSTCRASEESSMRVLIITVSRRLPYQYLHTSTAASGGRACVSR